MESKQRNPLKQGACPGTTPATHFSRRSRMAKAGRHPAPKAPEVRRLQRHTEVHPEPIHWAPHRLQAVFSSQPRAHSRPAMFPQQPPQAPLAPSEFLGPLGGVLRWWAREPGSERTSASRTQCSPRRGGRPSAPETASWLACGTPGGSTKGGEERGRG